MLFAAVGLIVGGIDDVVIDIIWIVRALWRRIAIYTRYQPASMATLAAPRAPGRIAVFVGAWDEAAVIGQMLETALDRFDHDDYRLFVGVYPNDPATVAAVEAVRTGHPRGDRIRIVVGVLAGPITKAEALNRLWRALGEEEALEGRRFKAVVLHDAEDVVHPAELRLFDTLIERFALVQLPVLPLADPHSRWISGHYLDEFAEAHSKQLVVREALGAGIPSAGVGCAIARDALDRLAARRGGLPFDATSLTEDYELGLRLGEMGLRGIFVWLPATKGGPPVAVRAYFPATFEASVRQKTRWVTGIALSGWDRLGWRGGLAEGWMRLRDRRAVLAHIVIAAAYGAILLGAVAAVARLFIGGMSTAPSVSAPLLAVTTAMLVWRLAMRALMVAHVHGWREGARAIPRTLVSNIIGMASTWQAVRGYIGARRGSPIWDKTRHHFPARLPAP
jgi:adsorption protein B